ncbi:thrombomodulin-like [Aulostomus maculatus]
MRDVTGLFAVVLVVLQGRGAAVQPDGVYCLENQCCTLFRDPSEFTTAQNQCRDTNGNLMTVRSSVSRDILSILLANLTGRYWIGLHRPAGCPDAAAELRGYQWVTKDSLSDFSNWAPTFDSSCSSPRCVSVSGEENLQWNQESCDAQPSGFLCEYVFDDGCSGLEAAGGESVTYVTPMGFGGVDLLSLPPGSEAIRMPAETKYVCFSQQWLRAPWTCEILDGGCEYKCATDPNNVPSCYCPQGQTINLSNKVTCEDATDEPCARLRCDHACYESDGSYKCMCDHGFKLAPDGRSCVDFNDCTDERQCPGENFMCVNTVGGFQCVCRSGFRMTGGVCVDEDECVSAPCEHTCINTPGGYNCSCYDGYRLDPKSPNKCKLFCGMKECPAECDPNDQYQCYCPDGYISEERQDHVVCIDMDECAYQYCEQKCKNTFGGYVCACLAGYTLVDEYMCVKNEDEDGEGSGETTAPSTTPTTPHPTPHVTHAGPTRRPSAVSPGGLAGIIVCTTFFIVLAVFLAHHIFCSSRRKLESAAALKAPEGEAHCLQPVPGDTC